MRITCPNCQTIYEFADDLLSEDKIEMHCNHCGEKWLYDSAKKVETELVEENINITTESKYSESEVDLVIIDDSFYVSEEEADEDLKSPEEIVENIIKIEEMNFPIEEKSRDIKGVEENLEIDSVFSRINIKTEIIESDFKKASFIKRMWLGIKSALGLKNKFNRWFIYFVLISAAVISILYYRYDIVKEYPSLEEAYSLVGLESKILGYGLKFENVSRSEEVLDDVTKLSVKGFVVSHSEEDVVLPTIHIKLLKHNGNLIEEYKYKLKANIVPPRGRVAFKVTVDKPSINIKYILVTFIE